MTDKNFEKKLKKTLEKDANKIVTENKQMKEQIWSAISKRADIKNNKTNSTKGWGAAAAFGAVLLIGAIIITANTEPGQVAMQSIRDTFVERKTQEIEIEGQREQTNTQLETNEELNYVIYIEEDRYQMIQGEAVDRIEMLDAPGGDFPEVAMEIWKEENTTTEEVLENIREEIKSAENMNIRQEESVEVPIKAEVIQGMGLDGSGNEEAFSADWDTPIHRYYVTETVNNQVFVIKQIYFLEAAEGHGARFHYMLETFEITEE